MTDTAGDRTKRQCTPLDSGLWTPIILDSGLQSSYWTLDSGLWTPIILLSHANKPDPKSSIIVLLLTPPSLRAATSATRAAFLGEQSPPLFLRGEHLLLQPVIGPSKHKEFHTCLLQKLLQICHLLLLLCQLHLDCSNCNCFVTPFVLLLQQRLILIASFNLSAATLLDSAISNCNELAVIHLLLQVTPLLLLFLQPLSIQLTTLARQILVSPWS